MATTYIRDRSSDCEAFEGSGLSLVCALYNHHFNLVPSGSGALRVENPNQLESLITDEISVTKDDFMHMYVSNGSANKGLYFDNSCGERSRTILVTMLDGSNRQTQWVLDDARRSPYSHASRAGGCAAMAGVINHYGSSCACAPDIADGLRIAGLDGYSHDYTSAPLSAGKNMYTGKELQTEEFQPFISTGLEMPAPSGHAIQYAHASRQTCVTITGYDFIRACPLSAVLMRPLCLVHARFGACPERLALSEAEVSRRDPQLGRPALSVVEVWFALDPATARESVWTEQFSNPYLAMGRTKREESLRWSDLASGQPVGEAVMYVDPDGEFIFPALMIAGFMAGSMGTAAIADSKDVSISGSDILMGGFKGAVAGAMIASGVAAPAAKTTTGTVVSKKALMAKSGLKSGTINAVSNYDFESGWNDFGIGTFADFGAGFAGGALAVDLGRKLPGMLLGGLLNTAFNTGYGAGGYEHAQAFAGGALSVYAGTGKWVKGEKLFSKYELKNTRTFLKYGAQSSVYDFAYTDEKYYTKRKGWEHAVIFGMGGLSGVGAERYFTGKGSELLSSQARISRGAGIYAAEWSVTSWIKQRSYARENGYPMGGFYTGNSSRAKGWQLLDKWRIGSRGILGAQ